MVLSSIFLYVYAIVHVYFLEVCKLFMYGIGMTGGHLFYITYWATKAAAAHQRRQAGSISVDQTEAISQRKKKRTKLSDYRRREVRRRRDSPPSLDDLSRSPPPPPRPLPLSLVPLAPTTRGSGESPPSSPSPAHARRRRYHSSIKDTFFW
jgi:hypothetical protein